MYNRSKENLTSPLVGKEQARGYANSLKFRFIILSNGILHYLWDLEQGNPVKIEKFPSQEDLEMKNGHLILQEMKMKIMELMKTI